MNYWLFKTEPTDYSYGDLVRDRRTVWDGVRNNQALQFLRQIRRGDCAFIYHTGKDKHIAGVAEVVRGTYADPEFDDDKIVVVDVKASRAAATPVTLASVKSDAAFADFHLVRVARLSVMPVPSPLWKKLCKMGGIV